MNNHQKVPDSHAVENTQPRQAACPTRVAYCRASTSMDNETICQKPLGWPALMPGKLQPGNGHATEAACRTPPARQIHHQK